MNKCRSIAAALALAPTVAVTPAFAQEATASSAQGDVEVRRQLTAEIVAIGYPVEEREAMFMRVIDQMEAQMFQSVSGQIKDNGAMEILRSFQKDVRADQEVILRDNIPLLMDGWADSYADIFSENELRDILGFLRTETGRTFMMRSADVMSNPHFAKANQAYMNEAIAVGMKRMPELMKALVDYKSKSAGE